MNALADLEKLRANLGGVKNMQRPPDAMFVVDLKTEVIAVKEAQRLRIPIIGLVDTNCDPDGIEYVVPGNDDAIKSCALITSAIGDIVGSGLQTFRAEEEAARKEAEEKARKEAEEKARQEAEEQARKEAEEQARKEQLVAGGEDEVAEAVEAGGRPNPDPHVPQKADRTERPLTDSPGEQAPEKPAEDAPITNEALKEDAAEPPAEVPAAPADETPPPPAEQPATTTGAEKDPTPPTEESK
jgi:small subunit ribosomal protein S2